METDSRQLPTMRRSAGNDSGNGSGDDGKGNTGDKNTDGKTEIPEQPVLPPEEAEEGLVTDLSSRTVFVFGTTLGYIEVLCLLQSEVGGC